MENILSLESLKWAVCYDVGNNKRHVTALFQWYVLAQDYIEKVLPKDAKSRFYVVNLETGKTDKQ